MTQIWPGFGYPLGAVYDGAGTNFAIFSEAADRVELCLFDDDGEEERVRLREVDAFVYHAYLPGVGHPVIVDHLLALGVTAVELMPVHQFVQDERLVSSGLRNYWGYNTIGFFAPHNGYAASGRRGEQVQEFKAMVRSLHQAGIEV